MKVVTSRAAIGIPLAVILSAGTAASAQTPECSPDKPAPRPRHGIGLSLSGGAYRAALFHMGAIRRLNELGLLHRIDEISSVSGGSIASAHLATYLSKSGRKDLRAPVDPSIWEDQVARPFRQVARRDFRTAPLAKRLLPWNWFRASVEVDTMADRFASYLTQITLGDLPEHPDFVYDATDLAFGVSWEFRRNRMGDYLAGYIRPHPAEWPLARAVAASNCFPPLFQPMPIRYAADRFHDGHAKGEAGYAGAVANLRLTDGGNYDNLGLEPIWKDREIVLVSDGGGTFDFEPDKKLLWRIQRYPSILDNQLRALHKRWLYASFEGKKFRGAYWRIANARCTYLEGDTQGYSKDLAENFLTNIRTDLNGFNDVESKILENHGYLVADAAVRRWLPDLVGEPWPELRLPHPEWLPPQKSECQIKQALFPGYDCGSAKAPKRVGEPGGPS